MAALSLLFLKRTKGRVLFFLSGSQSMKAAGVKEIKQELNQRTSQELLEICLRLSKFKKENKELLTYLLFESFDESGFIEKVKEDLEDQFRQINRGNIYYIKKSLRKILRTLKKFPGILAEKKPRWNCCFISAKSLLIFPRRLKGIKL